MLSYDIADSLSITRSAFPTPALAIRTTDPVELARVCAFADHQASAARGIAAEALGVVANARTRCDIQRAIIAALSAAADWRYQLAKTTRERRRGRGLELTAARFRTPITDTTTNYDRLGYVGRARLGSVWDPATRTYVGGAATPASEILALFGQYATERFAREAPAQDVLRNLVRLDDGTTVPGNALLRGVAAQRAAAELVARIAARGADASQIETGGDPIYTATGLDRDRARLRQAAIDALADAFEAAAEGDTASATRRWVEAAYALYQAPTYKKGSDAVTRVVLVALGTLALSRVPRLPQDIDLRAYVLGQRAFCEQLLALNSTS